MRPLAFRTACCRWYPIDLRSVSVAEGVRAALATAAIVLLNEWLRWPWMTEAALAALPREGAFGESLIRIARQVEISAGALPRAGSP